VVEVESELMVAYHIKPEASIVCQRGESPKVPAKWPRAVGHAAGFVTGEDQNVRAIEAMIGHDRELVTCRDGAQGLGTRKICMSHHDPADSPMVQVLHRLGDYRVESARHGHHWLATTVHSEVGHGVVVADHDGGHPLQRLQDPGGGRNGKAFSVVSAERWSEATLCLGERLDRNDGHQIGVG